MLRSLGNSPTFGRSQSISFSLSWRTTPYVRLSAFETVGQRRGRIHDEYGMNVKYEKVVISIWCSRFPPSRPADVGLHCFGHKDYHHKTLWRFINIFLTPGECKHLAPFKSERRQLTICHLRHGAWKWVLTRNSNYAFHVLLFSVNKAGVMQVLFSFLGHGVCFDFISLETSLPACDPRACKHDQAQLDLTHVHVTKYTAGSMTSITKSLASIICDAEKKTYSRIVKLTMISCCY